jgi:probable rRNA maturation factor
MNDPRRLRAGSELRRMSAPSASAAPGDGPSIQFFDEDLSFTPADPEALRRWIVDTAAHEGFTVGEVGFIFCSDAHLLGINQQYLEHDDYTDIITFPYHEGGKEISGDVFISVERVAENAGSFGVAFGDELHRVIIHGVLHLLGYVDATEADKTFMRQKEDFYLERRPAMTGTEEFDA